MATFDPADIFCGNQAVWNVTVKALCAEAGVSDADRAAVKAELRKDWARRVPDPQNGWPVRSVYTCCLTEVVQAVESNHKRIQQVRRNRTVPPCAHIVREVRVEEIIVQRAGQIVSAVRCFLIPAAVGEEELSLR